MLDSSSIAQMSEMSMASDVTMTIMRFIPGVFWHVGVNTTLLEQLYYMVFQRFDRSSGRPVVIPKLRNKAYLGAKALLYLAIQHKRISDESDKAVFKLISSRHPIVTRA